MLSGFILSITGLHVRRTGVSLLHLLPCLPAPVDGLNLRRCPLLLLELVAYFIPSVVGLHVGGRGSRAAQVRLRRIATMGGRKLKLNN